jgi:hypothetical protein
MEHRELYEEVVDGVTIVVTASMDRDDDADPRTDGDWASAEDIEAWKRNEWEYVSFLVAVELNGVPIGFGDISGVVHGSLGEDPDKEGVPNDVDAWDLTPRQYGLTEDGRRWVATGSALNGAIVEAIDNARKWLRGLPFAGAEVSLVDGVAKWADPNKP